MVKYKIIAELAQGYEGKVDIAKQLIESAKLAGADYAKIQVVYADELSTSDYKDYKIFKSLELDKVKWNEISKFAQKKKIKLITEVFGKKSVAISKFIKSKFYKIHPTDINNFELLRMIKSIKPKKIFIGIGGAKEKEVEKCLSFFEKFDVVLLHGHQSLPTPNQDMNIQRISNIISKYKNKYNKISIGIADHAIPEDKTIKDIVSMAIGAGARYIEKHLTTNRIYKLEDYHSALNPDEFKKFRSYIDELFKIYGDGGYLSSNSERKYRNNTRRSIFLKKNLKKYAILKEDFFVMKRSPKSSDLKNISEIIGKKAKKNLYKNKLIYKKDLL
jgi:hypothetical protein